MKRGLLLISVLALMVVGAALVSAAPVKIVFARGKDVTPASTSIVKAFNEKYKGKIEIEYVEMPSSTDAQHDQYVTAFSAKGSEYDVFQGDCIWPAEFANAEYTLPLDRLIKRDKINMKDYMAGPVGALTYKGKIWGMPQFIDAGLLFYRKDIVTTPPKTWDELIQMAKKYKGQNGTKYGFLAQAKQYEGLVCNAVEYITSYGGAVVDGNGKITINSPQTINGLKKMLEVIKSDFTPSNITAFTELESHTAFLEGQSVFIRNWPYQWGLAQDPAQSKIVGKVGVVALPKGDKRSAATLGGWEAMINKYTKHPEEAWTFLKFLTGPEGQKISAIEGGLAPTYLPLYNDKDVLKANPFFAEKGFVDGLKAAVARPVSPIYPKLSDIMQIEISKMLAGSQTPEEAVKVMEKSMKQAVAAQ